MKNQKNVVICPPCGESVARATKEGQNKNKGLWPLLPRLTAVLPPQGREMICGFTLIELLVVVLIIGILAAVAVPQYQKAVEKSKATQAVTLLKSLSEATKIYEEATGTWPSSFDVLDVTLPGNFKPTTPEKVLGTNSVDARSNGEWEIQLEKNRPVFYHDKIFMVRTNGRYKGAGFMYSRSGLYPASLNKKIHCLEPWLEGIYCRKLFGGTVVANGKWQLFSYR